MSDSQSPGLLEYFNAMWAVVVALAMGVVGFIRHDRNRLKAIEAIIPPNALKDGDMLVTAKGCLAMRNACTNHLITEELLDTMQVVKKTLILQVTHNERIPQPDRDEIISELTKDRRIHERRQ